MKAIIIGATGYLENGLSMANGLRNMGIDHGYFGYRTFLSKYGQPQLKTTLFNLLEEHQPEWCFCQYQYNTLIPPGWFKEIRDLLPTTKISLMSVDMRNELDQATIAAGKYADVCFQKGRRQKYIDRGLNCHILQEGYSDLLFFKQSRKKQTDIVFAGGLYVDKNFPATRERISSLSYLCKKYNMKVFGPGWNNILPSSCARGSIELPKVNDVYNMSKIVLNINHYNDIEHYWSIRMIEGMASGSMMLTKYVPGLEKYFTNFKDIVWFYSLSDCIELLNYYLKHDDEREVIAKNGLLTVQQSFKWESIMKKAYDIVFGK